MKMILDAKNANPLAAMMDRCLLAACHGSLAPFRR
jgi:hypothetical protein